MQGERTRGSLLDIAWLLLVLYGLSSFVWRREAIPQAPSEAPWPAIRTGQPWQPDPGLPQEPLPPRNEWEGLNGEGRREGWRAP